jgi:hypothetical protein
VNIGWAIVHMMVGNKKCRRTSWPANLWIAVQKPDANSKMTDPYVYLGDGQRMIPWLPNQSDLLAEDYEWAT